jgi:hypothetical protein
MGNWAERAAKRFQEKSTEKRKAEESNIHRDAKTQSGAEIQWKTLVDSVRTEAKNFNALMGREFLQFQRLEDEVEIHAPKLWLKFWIDFQLSEIKFEFRQPFPSLKKTSSGHFRIVLLDEQVCFTGDDGLAQPIETVGASLLDPLII